MEAMQRAAALYQAGRLDEADAQCLEVLRITSGRLFAAWHLRSAIAARRGDPQRCHEFATRALALDPANAEVLSNRGAALRQLGRFEEALADYDRALALAPAAAEAHNNRGVALAALARYAEALAAYDRALQLDPGFDRARFNRALARLTLGDLRGGFADHEARWTGADNQFGRPTFAQPRWTGAEPLAGRTILLHAEQGLGDAIQFARYVPQVAARGARVVLQVHRPLAPLLSQLPVAQVVAFEEPLPAFDLHCALMSLPLAFGTTLETIPAAVPYLRAPATHLERWRGRLGERRVPRVGLAWSGNPAQANDRNRSMPLAALAPLRECGCELVSLQKDVRAGDRAALAAMGLADFSPELRDFADTAALARLMDLVVSVDSSVAHLAGAMARPLVVMLCHNADWRWLTERCASPWYPTAKLLRQPAAGDWNAVAGAAARELRALA
jgi:hypothetical protein